VLAAPHSGKEPLGFPILCAGRRKILGEP
jgi:hypothetical protein